MYIILELLALIGVLGLVNDYVNLLIKVTDAAEI